MKVDAVINEEALTEVSKYFINPKLKKGMISSFIASFFVILCGIICHEIGFIILAVILLCILLLERVMIKNSGIKGNLNRIRESYDTDSIKLTLNLLDDGTELFNSASNGTSKMKYDSYINLYESSNYYLLTTKSLQCVIIEKSKLNKDEKEKFFKIIKSSCKNIKIHIKGE